MMDRRTFLCGLVLGTLAVLRAGAARAERVVSSFTISPGEEAALLRERLRQPSGGA